MGGHVRAVLPHVDNKALVALAVKCVSTELGGVVIVKAMLDRDRRVLGMARSSSTAMTKATGMVDTGRSRPICRATL